MELGIRGKTALVMGASRGIGRAIAEGLISEGVKTIISARNIDDLEKTAKEIGAGFIQADTSVAGSGTSLVEEVIKKYGPVDILIVNTGGPASSGFDNTGNDAWQEGFQSLFLSSVDAMRACLAHMKEQKWGRIGFITSIAAKEPVPNLIVSNAIRAGVHGLINSISKEYAPYGITVNAVMPAYALTDRLSHLVQKSGLDLDKISLTIPARRVGDPKEVADLMVFLMSEKASYITGQAISCDGGLAHSI